MESYPLAGVAKTERNSREMLFEIQKSTDTWTRLGDSRAIAYLSTRIGFMDIRKLSRQRDAAGISFMHLGYQFVLYKYATSSFSD